MIKVLSCSVFSQKLAMKAQVADAFLGKFQLKPEEVQVLRGSREGILHPVSGIARYCGAPGREFCIR